MARAINRWRFKYMAEFGHFEPIELSNGQYIEGEDSFVSVFSRHVARYKIIPGLTDKPSGFDEKTDIILVSNKIPNDEISEFMDIDAYYVKFNGKFYKIKQVEEDVVRVVGQHMITCQLWSGNGKQPHPGRN